MRILKSQLDEIEKMQVEPALIYCQAIIVRGSVTRLVTFLKGLKGPGKLLYVQSFYHSYNMNYVTFILYLNI